MYDLATVVGPEELCLGFRAWSCVPHLFCLVWRREVEGTTRSRQWRTAGAIRGGILEIAWKVVLASVSSSIA